MLGASLLIAAVPPPTQPVVLSPEQAAKEGRALASEILAQKPAENSTNTGVMTISDAKNQRTNVPIEFSITLTSSNWLSKYSTRTTSQARYASFTVLHSDAQPNRYLVPNVNPPPTDPNQFHELNRNQLFTPFAGSDFWLADLSLDFLQWPEQHLIRKEMRRSRSCNVLESINPQPAPGAYSRVVSWIDIQSTNGILFAEAYDFRDEKLKAFIPRNIKNGSLEKMEMDNTQTDSRTTVVFDVSPPK